MLKSVIKKLSNSIKIVRSVWLMNQKWQKVDTVTSVDKKIAPLNHPNMDANSRCANQFYLRIQFMPSTFFLYCCCRWCWCWTSRPYLDCSTHSHAHINWQQRLQRCYCTTYNCSVMPEVLNSFVCKAWTKWMPEQCNNIAGITNQARDTASKHKIQQQKKWKCNHTKQQNQ